MEENEETESSKGALGTNLLLHMRWEGGMNKALSTKGNIVKVKDN